VDFAWTRTINRFQAVLHRDGSIEMSYQELAAEDAIVGIYPEQAGAEDRQRFTFLLSRSKTVPSERCTNRFTIFVCQSPRISCAQSFRL
jgi:hypothetical protein